MGPLCNFGVCQEDERTEAQALHLPGGRVLGICSAGDLALSLLALGAGRVDAVDLKPAQVHLAELKLAAIRALAPDEAARFLGFLPATADGRRAGYARVLELVPPSSRAFWESHGEVVGRGVIWAGRFERFVRRLRRLTAPLLRRRFERLFDAGSLQEQRAVFDRELGIAPLRWVFRVAFAPAAYQGRGMDPRGLRHLRPGAPLGERWFARFRAMCTATPARENYFLQLLVLGRLLGPEAGPAYLSPRGAAELRARPEAISFIHASIGDWLDRSEPGRYDRFHLSNVCDWMTPEAHDRLLAQVVAHVREPAWVVWRALHARPGVPAALAGRLRPDPDFGGLLSARDRFPVYEITPARVA